MCGIRAALNQRVLVYKMPDVFADKKLLNANTTRVRIQQPGDKDEVAALGIMEG